MAYNLLMNKVKIIVYAKSNELIRYLIYNNICYYDLECINDYFSLIVKLDDYRKISVMFKTKIIKYYGKKGIIEFFNFHKYMIISFIISLFMLYLLSNTIFEVNINIDDKDIKDLLLTSLKDEGIYKYRKKKSFNEINNIKKRILEKNEDKLEWIEIIEKGVTYNVEVTPRVTINNSKTDKKKTSIYAKKSGVIKRIIVYRGTKIKEINDYVKKGDLLISGNILKNDKVVSKVKSNGLVYAETWYRAKVNVPFKYQKKEFTGKVINHYYLDINGFKFTIMGKYDSDNVISENKLILSKPYLFFDVYKESKKLYENKTYTLSNDEAYQMAISEAENEIKKRLDKDEYIISKNVLKKEVNSSKMYVEVFFKVYENIGFTSSIDELGDKNGDSN